MSVVQLKTISFLLRQFDVNAGTAKSVPTGPVTLYGSCYAVLGLYYLGYDDLNLAALSCLIKSTQDLDSGLLVGTELAEFETASGAMHSREHLHFHLTCAAIPVCQQFGIKLRPITAAHRYCDLNYLSEWSEARNWKNAWFEGNNILFVGQLLVYLRDVERHPGAESALQFWFDWLDSTVDPNTGLWGTNGFCSPMEAVYGGYHQLLVYYYENHLLPNPRGLVDTVLLLQHRDGGFNPDGNGGACEDVDSVDILVNCYKRLDYRRAEIRVALKRCIAHILATQNPDGGFPYCRNREQSHMGIPGTQAGPNVSCTFPTWFRIHTLALIAEIIPEHHAFDGITFRFNQALSMGWHASPPDWELDVSPQQRREEAWRERTLSLRRAWQFGVRQAGRVTRKAKKMTSVRA